ncbi:MAG: hypothetical protein QNK37_03445 [Acidobacteriota bacterium]|nr:hypothetical protein [Acidobacteriota bacterium]
MTIFPIWLVLLGFQTGAPQLAELGSWGESTYRTVTAAGKETVLVLGYKELIFFDKAGAEEPEVSRRFPLPHQGYLLSAHADRVLIAGDQTVLIDISNPTEPEIIGSFRPHLGNYIRDAILGDGFACLATADGFLLVYDLTNPAQPKPAAVQLIDFPSDMALRDRHLYVTGNHLDVFDLTQLQAPVRNRLGISRDAVVIRNDTLFLTGVGVIEAYSLDNPMQPALVGSLQLDIDFVIQAEAAGDHLIVNAGFKTVLVDIGDPAAMTSVTIDKMKNGVFAVQDDRVYQATDGDLVVFDIQDPVSWSPVPFETFTGEAFRLVPLGDYGLLAHGSGGLRALDLRDLDKIVQVSHIERETRDVLIAAGVVWAAHGRDGIAAFNLSASGELSLRGAAGYLPTRAVTRHGDYILAAGDGLYVYGIYQQDLREPLASFELPGLDGPSETDLTVIGNHVYVSHLRAGLLVYDIADPLQPRYVGYRPVTTGATGVVHADDMLLLSSRGNGLTVLKPGPDADATIVGHGGDAYRPSGLSMRRNVAWLAGESGLRFYDTADPLAPIDLGAFPIHGGARSVTFNGRAVFLAGAGGKATIYSIRGEETYRTIIPWVVNNDNFQARISLVNAGNRRATAALTAVTREGRTETASVTVNSGGRFVTKASDLFPDLTGYSLTIDADQPLLPRFFIFNSQGSPSQARGQLVGKLNSELLFGYVPGEHTAAIVLTAPEKSSGTTPVAATLFDASGKVAGETRITLEANRPNALLVRSLFPTLPQDATLRVHATDGSRLAGTTFIFDANGQPSMAEAFTPGAPL